MMIVKELREDRRPADLWFWSDWFSSFDVRSCSLASRGLWMDMLGIMSRAEIKGALTINGKQIGSKELAKIVGITERETIPLLKELEVHKVFSRLPDGIIINRRMYKTSKLSQARAEAGKKGASLRWQKDGKVHNKDEASIVIEDEDDNEINKKFAEFWAAYPYEGRLAKKESRIKFGAIIKRGELAEFIRGFHGYLDFLKHQKVKKNFVQTPMYAKTFLNGRWSEFVDFKFEPEL